jgi:predicted PurR-regulated permease PerM
VILALAGLIGYTAYQLAEPTTAWLAKLPQSFRQLERKLQPLRQSVQEVSDATKQVEKMTQIPEADPEQASVKVEVQRQNLGQLMLNTTSSFAAGVVTMFILLYFLLATGRSLLLKLVKVLPRLHDKKAAVTIMHQIEHDTSIYLLTVTLINLGLGIATSLLLFMLGMPNPLLWGVIAGVLNFVPYVSAVITTALLGCAALFTFEQVGKILLIPTVYIVLNCLEGFVITPMVHSQRFTLNPVVIMIWLAFWSWIWGIAGTLLAMPMLITLKSLCDHVESLASISEFLHG